VMEEKKRKFYYAKRGDTKGPFSLAEMVELVSNEEIFLETSVWTQGMSEWTSLQDAPFRHEVLPDGFKPTALPPKKTAPPPPPPKRTSISEDAVVSLSHNSQEPQRKQNSQKTSLSPKEGGGRFSIHELRRASRKLSRRRPSQVYLESLESGEYIWVEEPSVVWELCRIIEQDDTMVHVVKLDSGAIASIDTNFQETHRHNGNVVPDMTSLHHLNEPAILYNLAQRTAKRLPYTYMGSVLIAVNPLEPIDMPELSQYIDTPINPEKPHPYAIAGISCLTLSAKITKSVLQSIVISNLDLRRVL
jgi:hypothetical protein